MKIISRDQLSLLLSIGLMLSTVCLGQEWAPEWRKLVPLQSSRMEVERTLGKPKQSFDSYARYENENGRFSVWYSLGGCGHKVDGRQWNVERGLLTSLLVYVNDRRPLVSYSINAGDYRRTEMPHDRVLYVSSDDSLIIETIMPAGREEFVYAMQLDPSREQKKLLCR